MVVAVDTKEPYWESYAPEDLERVLIVATSVASHATELDYSIGLFTNDMPIPVNQPMIVPPGNGPDQLGRILEELATVREYAFGPMSERLGENVRHFPIGSTIAIVTAFISPSFVNSIVGLRRRGHKIVVLYVGKERCPDLEDGIVVHNLRDHLIELEEHCQFSVNNYCLSVNLCQMSKTLLRQLSGRYFYTLLLDHSCHCFPTDLIRFGLSSYLLVLRQVSTLSVLLRLQRLFCCCFGGEQDFHLTLI